MSETLMLGETMAHEEMGDNDFILYVDDSGDPKPNPLAQGKHFALGGVLIAAKDADLVSETVRAFKALWKIDSSIPLHGNEIRTRKKNFSFLGKTSWLSSPGNTYQAFLESIGKMFVELPLAVHACVVNRRQYLARYSEQYGILTWEMKRSAFEILLERGARYAQMNNGRLLVIVESSGPSEDKNLEKYFYKFCKTGASFNPARSAKYDPMTPDELTSTLAKLDFDDKASAGLQLADLCLFPVGTHRFYDENIAYDILNNNQKLIDHRLRDEDKPRLGIKYYCFD